MNIHGVLHKTWVNCVVEKGSPTERDFLRSLHSRETLTELELSLNDELLHSGNYPYVKVTSIWVDHTPQCWFYPVPQHIPVRKNKTQSSCELADLLIVVWDDSSKSSGLAWLLQGKRGKTFNCISRSGSTKIERYLLENGPRFCLSFRTSLTSPSKFFPIGKVDGYCLDYLTNNNQYDYCDFLQIKDATSKRWPSNFSPYQVVWPLTGTSYSLGQIFINMIKQVNPNAGQHFSRNSKVDDWNELVNFLLDETYKSSRVGTAQGSLQNHSYLLPQAKRGIIHNNLPSGPVEESEMNYGIPIIELTRLL